jgi:hypothetical protein
MADLKEKTKATLLSSTTAVDMKTAASVTLFTVPTGKVCRITSIVVRDTTASLAGGTSYSITNWRQAFSLAGLTTANTGYINVYGADLAQYTEIAAGTAVQITITTGATAAGTATIDLFGYLT